jgi:hypothetical protein
MSAQIASLSKLKQTRIVDELGTLKAQIASLQDQYDQKVAVFKQLGVGEYSGKAYKLNVYEASRTTLDNKLVKSLLTPAQINTCSVFSISLVAKLGTL